MIVDSHAYCFQPGDEAAGFVTAAQHLAWIQTSQALHHQPAWRLRNRAPAEEIWIPFSNPRLSLEVCFPVRIGDLLAFPYTEVQPTLELMTERVGCDRLMWGTDIPFQNRFCTYRQSRDWIERTCNFLSQDDLNLLMGGTAQRVLDLYRLSLTMNQESQ